MASFKSILQAVGKEVLKIAGVEQAVSPYLKLLPVIGPVVVELDPLIQRIVSGVATVENAAPADATGAFKADVIVADFEAMLGIAGSGFTLAGKELDYSEPELRAGIADLVSAFNHFRAVKESIAVKDVKK